MNWSPYTPDTTNFWSEVEPLFHNLPNNVIIFAGDLSANREATPYMYYNYDNVTFIASGMGSGINDNFNTYLCLGYIQIPNLMFC